MASSSGTSSGSTTLIQNSGSEEDLQHAMDQRKLKRKQSNRESARRSRQRKEKLLGDLMAQVTQLKNENNQILTKLSLITQQSLSVESENSVLRIQTMELNHRLHSLNEIINCLHSNYIGIGLQCQINQDIDGLQRPWNSIQGYTNLPIMASADVFQY